MSPTRVALTTQELIIEVGCSYRQIDRWVRLGYVPATGSATPGTGHPREFTPEAVFTAKVVHTLSSFGFSSDALERAVNEIKGHSAAARLVYVKADGSTDWAPGASAAIVIDLDQLRLPKDGNHAA